MKMLLIENDGEVDVLAFTLMGASTKRNSKGQIGFFGSGNKYAIANLLRREIGFTIYSGEERITPVLKPVVMRDNTFNQISFKHMDRVLDTSITTDMGPKWEPWYILRELYCNALDEGGCQLRVIDADEEKPLQEMGAPGKTRFYIELVDELVDVVNHWNGYFTKDRLDLIEHIQQDDKGLFDNIHEVKVYHKYDDKLRIYRKGVLIYCGDEKAIFDYDLPSAEINEERILTNMWAVRSRLGTSIAAGATDKLLTRLIKGMDKYNRISAPYAEEGFDLAAYMHRNEDNWKSAMDGLTIINSDRKDTYEGELKGGSSIMLSSSMAYSISNIPGAGTVLGVPKKGLAHSFKETNPTMEQKELLDKAFEFLVVAGFIFGDIKIQTVNFDEYAISGMADIAGNRIFIGQNCFDKGLKYITSTLMEEHSHILSRQGDCTRGFQNYLIDKWLCELEEKVGARL